MNISDDDKYNKIYADGMWLPSEVAFNDELTWNDKFVWWIISSLDGTEKHCFASNAFISKNTGILETTISNIITKLIKLEYVEKVSFDGRKRTIKINPKAKDKYEHVKYKWNNNFYNIANGTSERVEKQPFSKSKGSIGVNPKPALGSTLNLPFSKTGGSIGVNPKHINNRLNKIEDINSFNSPSENIKELSNESIVENQTELDMELPKLKRRKKTISDKDKKTISDKLKSNFRKKNGITDIESAKQILSFWNSLPGLPKHKTETTKVYLKSLKSIDTFLKKYEKSDIEFRMKVYSDLLSNTENTSINTSYYGHRVSCNDFFKLDSTTLEKIKKTLPGFEKSWFNECESGKEPQMKFQTLITDRHPKLTEKIKKLYYNLVNEKLIIDTDTTAKQENLFRHASKKFYQFMDKNKSKLRLDDNEGKKYDFQNAAHYIFDAFDFFNYKNISPYTLAANSTYNNLLPRFFDEYGMIKTDFF